MLRFENKNNGRFYYVSTQIDLLQDKVLIVLRGGKNRRAIQKVYGYKSDDEINKRIRKIISTRLRNGYVLK